MKPCTAALPKKIISGGQTGVDRAALDAALEAGVAAGGWVPEGRLAEDGVIPLCYPNLEETKTQSPEERTRRNVESGDGTVVVVHGTPRGGTAYTVSVARDLKKPLLVLDLQALTIPRAVEALRDWVKEHSVAVLNVAGPRASEDPLIHDQTFRLISELLNPTT